MYDRRMAIFVNEQPVVILAGETALAAAGRLDPAADVIVLNGAVVSAAMDRPLVDGDRLVLIACGRAVDDAMLELLMAARHTHGVHAKVKAGVVGIAGLGGLGSAAAIALARTGVGKLVLVDFDIVEPSNLNRQHYFVDQLGEAKADALVATLRRINPYLHYDAWAIRVTAENVAALFDECDVLIEAFDAPDQKAMLLDVWGEVGGGKPIILASGLAGYESGNTVQVRKLGESTYVVGDGVTAAAEGMGLMAPRVGIAACQQANVALRLLLGETDV